MSGSNKKNYPSKVYAGITPHGAPTPAKYCPECGLKLTKLGITSLFDNRSGDERIITDAYSPQMKRYLKTSNDRYTRKTVYIWACTKCEHILIEYGEIGIYFDIIGSLDKDVVAALIADKLSP